MALGFQHSINPVLPDSNTPFSLLFSIILSWLSHEIPIKQFPIQHSKVIIHPAGIIFAVKNGESILIGSNQLR